MIAISAWKINMDKKSQFLYQFRAFFVNSNSIPIPFFSIPIPSPIPGIESGIELNSHSIPELTPTLLLIVCKHVVYVAPWNFSYVTSQVVYLEWNNDFSELNRNCDVTNIAMLFWYIGREYQWYV